MISIIMSHQSKKFSDFGFTLSPQPCDNYDYLVFGIWIEKRTFHDRKDESQPEEHSRWNSRVDSKHCQRREPVTVRTLRCSSIWHCPGEQGWQGEH